MGFNDYGFYNGFDRESKLLHLCHKASRVLQEVWGLGRVQGFGLGGVTNLGRVGLRIEKFGSE